MTLKLLRLLTASLCLALLLAGGGARGGEPIGVRVPTVVAGSTSAGAALEFDAVLQPLHEATVTAQIGANVLALRAKAGDTVRRAQPLVRLDDREVRANSARSEAAVAQAQAELRNTQQALERNRELRKSGFISQAALDGADNQYRGAQAALGQSQAARAQAAVALGFAEIGAPFDGVVLATHVQSGDLALPGRALLTLYEPGRLRAVVQLPASRVAALEGAGDVKVVLPDGRALVPLTRELLPAADPVSQTVEWRLNLPDTAPATARPGQTVRVLVHGAPASAGTARLSLPAAAILRRGELTAVYVALAQGFALRAVRVGPLAGDTVEVLAGLGAGERVALDPVRAGLQGAVAQP